MFNTIPTQENAARANRRKGDLMIGYFLTFSFVLAFTIPEAVLTEVSALRSFTSEMATLIPSIDHLTKRSAFPEITRLYFSVLWTSVPIWVLIFCTKIPGLFSVQHVRNRKTLITFLYLTLMPSIPLFFAYFVGASDGGKIDRTMVWLLSNNRFGLAAAGSILIAASALALSSIVLWLIHIPQIYFDEPLKGESFR